MVDVLRIGDFVTLKVAKQGGLLCAEGILLHDLSLVEMPKVFDDALFCIHLQRQYSAAKELEEFLKKGKVDVRDISDANTAKYYQALKVCNLSPARKFVSILFSLNLSVAPTTKVGSMITI